MTCVHGVKGGCPVCRAVVYLCPDEKGCFYGLTPCPHGWVAPMGQSFPLPPAGGRALTPHQARVVADLRVQLEQAVAESRIGELGVAEQIAAWNGWPLERRVRQASALMPGREFDVDEVEDVTFGYERGEEPPHDTITVSVRLRRRSDRVWIGIAE